MVEPLHDTTIQMRQMLTARQRAREAFITTALWALYGYLWLPLVSLVAWYMGLDFAYEKVIQAGGPEELILLLLWFCIVCLVSLLVVVTWSGLQHSKYKGKGERRTTAPVLDLEAEREFWRIEESLQQQMKAAKVQTVSLDDNARIVSVS